MDIFRLALGAAMISFSAVFVKLVTVAPTTAGFYRMLFGGLMLSLIVLMREGMPRLRGWTLTATALAGLFFALDLGFWHRSVRYVGPGISTLLANFQVFILAAAGMLFFRERLTLRIAASILLAVVGLVLLVGADWAHVSAQYRWGVGLGLITAVCYAGYTLSLRSSRRHLAAASPLATIAVVSLISATLLGLACVVDGESLAIPGWKNAGLLVAYGLFAQVLGWVLISESIPRVRASQVGLILLLQPTLAFVWDAVFFGHAFSTIQVGGAALALVAIYLGSLRRT